jgi:hypothetical protein
MAHPGPPKHHRVLVLGLLVLTLAVRGGFLAAKSGDLAADPDGYRQLAVNLVEEGVYGYEAPGGLAGHSSIRPTAFRPPLYPLVLVSIGGTSSIGQTVVGVLHLLVGVATVGLVYVLTQKWQLGGWGLLAAALIACDPILLNQSTLLMTETLATFLALVGLICLTRLSQKPSVGAAALAGGALAIASLCRPTFLVWLGAVAVLLMLSSGRHFFRRQLPAPGVKREGEAPAEPQGGGEVSAQQELRPPDIAAVGGFGRCAILFVLVAAVVLSPWVCRNYVAFRRPVIATTHGGYTLMLGNNDGFYDFLQQSHWGEVWDSRDLDEQYNRIKQQHDYDEAEADRWAYRQAVACIQRRGGTFAYSCAVRIGRLWGLVPHRLDSNESRARRFARYAVGLWYVLVFLFAAIGAFSLGRRLLRAPWVWGLLLCLSFTAVHTLYWSNLRMRAPLMPVVCMAAALGAKRIATRRTRNHP